MNAFLNSCCRRWTHGAGRFTQFSFTKNAVGVRASPFRPVAALHSAFAPAGSRQARTLLSESLLQFYRGSARRIRDHYNREARTLGGPPKAPRRTWWQNLTRRIDNIPPDIITYALIGINFGVFIAWQIAIVNARDAHDRRLLSFMMQNFLSSLKNLTEGRFWTLVTSAFSQSALWHFVINAFVLGSSASDIQRIIGGSRFLGVYLLGGIVASLCSSLWWQNQTAGQGASGAIFCIFALYTCMFPTTTFLLFFIVPMPAWLCTGGLFLWDLYSLFQAPGSIDNAAHIGGMLTGVALYFLRFRRYF